MKRIYWAAAAVVVAIAGYQVHRMESRGGAASVEEAPPVVAAPVAATVSGPTRAKHVPMSLADAMKIATMRNAAETLAAQAPAERKQAAAGAYMGYYLVNARVRKEYCAARGVDIAPFVQAFEATHFEDRTRAESILSATNERADDAYPLVQQQLATAVAEDMRGVARNSNVSLDKACKMFAENPQQIVDVIKVPAAIAQNLQG